MGRVSRAAVAFITRHNNRAGSCTEPWLAESMFATAALVPFPSRAGSLALLCRIISKPLRLTNRTTSWSLAAQLMKIQGTDRIDLVSVRSPIAAPDTVSIVAHERRYKRSIDSPSTIPTSKSVRPVTVGSSGSPRYASGIVLTRAVCGSSASLQVGRIDTGAVCFSNVRSLNYSKRYRLEYCTYHPDPSTLTRNVRTSRNASRKKWKTRNRSFITIQRAAHILQSQPIDRLPW